MKILIPLGVIVVAGCNRVEQPTQFQAATQRTKPVVTSKAKVDGLGQAFRNQNPPAEVPPTARTLEPFRRLKLGMTRREVISRVGMSDKDIGSGIFIDVYKLSDGSTVTLGSGGSLIYAYHQRKKGEAYELLKSEKTTTKSS